MKTFYFYDYETFGLSPYNQRISQFGGIRTDENFNILDEKMFYCKPTNDSLPAPKAVGVTGITPQLCEKNGLIEHEFIKKINKEFTKPDTCIVGYNSIAFDDEYTRHTLFRNFIDPYAWHWQNGNTRWDILLVARFCFAHKETESLEWVINEKNQPVFKLDQLAPKNKIKHTDAHDALSDVKATIGIAKIIKETQPKFFDYALSLNDKNEVNKKVQLLHPMLLTDSKFGYKTSFTRLVTAICYHPEYKDRAIVFNLDQDPKILMALESDELKTLTFSKKADLPKGIKKLELSQMAFNQSHMFVCSPNPDSFKLSPILVEKFHIDMENCLKNLQYIQNNIILIEDKIRYIYKSDIEKKPKNDIDQALYDGFISNKDKLVCNEIQNLSIDEIGTFKPNFEDRKLLKLFLNFKARNYPELLTESEQEEWFEIVQSRVQNGANGFLSFESFEKSLSNEKINSPEKSNLWNELESYAQTFL